MKKVYLGEGVYVCVESGMFKLTTENGTEVTNTIYLEPEVYSAFLDYTNGVLLS